MVLKLDLDDPRTEQKLVTLGGIEFNMTEMPIDVFLFLNERNADRSRDGGNLIARDYYDGILMWLQSLKGTDVITSKWLDEVLSGNRLQQFIITVVRPAMLPPPLEFVDPAAGPTGGKSKSPRK